MQTTQDGLVVSDAANLSQNLIAIAVQVNENGIADHSGIIVIHNQVPHLFHYRGRTVYEYERPIPQGEWYIHKSLSHIPQFGELTTLSFLAHCELVLENAAPAYGFVFDGSYWREGVYVSPEGLSELCTCVGFCLNVISGFLYGNENYFHLQDWAVEANSTVFFEEWIANFSRRFPDLDHSDYQPYFRRITPSELITSAFANEHPIRKAVIDALCPQIELELYQLRLG